MTIGKSVVDSLQNKRGKLSRQTAEITETTDCFEDEERIQRE
jgi:hypothetical protein